MMMLMMMDCCDEEDGIFYKYMRDPSRLIPQALQIVLSLFADFTHRT